MKIQILQKSVAGFDVVISEFTGNHAVKMFLSSHAGKKLFDANRGKYALVSTFPEIASIPFHPETAVITCCISCKNNETVIDGDIDYCNKLTFIPSKNFCEAYQKKAIDNETAVTV